MLNSFLPRGQPIHSSMYRSLKTNLPKEVMAFPDFPFESSDESFVHHSKVLDYLEAYAQHFQLKKFIRFNTKVVSILCWAS
jgi:cation diffusion facilitator CzcD-associated flavoprotein CzcO